MPIPALQRLIWKHRRLRGWYQRAIGVVGRQVPYPFFSNVGSVGAPEQHPHALLLYLSESFLFDAGDSIFRHHQHYLATRYIAAVLGEYGYVVDVGSGRDPTLRLTRQYDLVISYATQMDGVSAALKDTTVKVHLVMGPHPRVHNANLRRRHALLRARRACEPAVSRLQDETMPYAEAADAIAGFGNARNVNTWRPLTAKPIYPVNNFAYHDTRYEPRAKDFEKARARFLFFASSPQVLKGLDLLLEIFPRHPQLELYVCSGFADEADFCACYRKELYETPNIHAIGWVSINGPRFYDVMRTCASVIHPTCSEGQPGSVVIAMSAGLIPLVTEEAGIDTEGFGLTFRDDSLEEIERVILDVAQRPPEWHRQQSAMTRHAAVTSYSEDAFVARWRTILGEILGSAASADT